MQWLKKQKEIIPIFGIGLTWLLYALVGEFRRPIHFIFCAILSIWVFFGLRILLSRIAGKEDSVSVTPKPKKAAAEPEQETDPIQAQGAIFLRKMQELDEQIPDVEMSAKLKQVGALMDQIFEVVRNQPEKGDAIRQLLDYYLPTTVKLLEKYVILQAQKIKGENIGDAMQKIEGLLDSVIVALQKQLDDMFKADVVDITADIRVMEKKLAAEGLAANDDFKEIL